MTAKRVLKSIVPPLLWNIGRDFKGRLLRSADHFRYAPQGWSTHLPEGATSQSYWATFLARERSACQTLIARVEAREPRSTADADDDLKQAIFGYVLALTARQKPQITVLDYGGSLGEYYWIGRALVPGVDLDYHCRELPEVAGVGRQVTPAVTWHTDDACLAQPHDLVMFSSSLQYLQDWQDILCRAAQTARSYLFLSDVPTVRDVPTYVATEHSAGVTNLHYQFNGAEIIDTGRRAGLRLVREFAMAPHPWVVNAPEQPTRVGWLFQRNPD